MPAPPTAGASSRPGAGRGTIAGVSTTATTRLARADDAAQVQAIYAPIVRDSAISFEADPPDEAEMRRRISATLTKLPWLVRERGGEVLGYAYARPHRDRTAYQWSVEVAVYVARHARGAGVGRGLYLPLLDLLASQGLVNAYAGITLPNPASVGLHEALGFTPVGVYRESGFKHGAWRDVGWWQRRLRELAVPPAPPTALPAMPTQVVRAALAAAGPPAR
jgi:phosphinothricin acetyltransferase